MAPPEKRAHLPFGPDQSQTHRQQCFEFCRQRKWLVIPAAAIVLVLPLLGLLALLPRGGRSSLYSSPVTLPSPEGYGAGNWSDAYQKAQKMVKQMTLEEMNNVTIGLEDPHSGCVGVSGSVPRLSFPGLCLHDAGNGVRATDGVNGYASGISIGASWNQTLARERARFMGAEFKKKGINVLLGPVVGPLGRTASGGRNWEGFAADPYLTGMLAAETIRGYQESVIASVKHWVGNEQETNRNPSDAAGAVTLATSANLDDQTMHEIYAWPFHDAVEAGVGAVMCSYNRVNSTYACENSKLTNGILKGEMSHQGFVVSDWSAQHAGLGSANAGLDLAMPTSSFWNNGQLEKAVNDASLNKTRLTDMATRILAAWYLVGMDNSSWPAPGIGMPPDLTKDHTYIDAKDNASRPNLLEQAIEGHVLLKNSNNALPLQKLKVLSIFGYDAVAQRRRNPGSPMLFRTNWEQIDLSESQLSVISANLPLTDAPGTANSTLIVGGGSGSNSAAYTISPFDAISEKARQDGTSLFHDLTSLDPAVVASSDACLVLINEYASEGWDRPNLADPGSDTLVSNVADSCNNTVVIVHNAGIRVVDAWIDHQNVSAVIFAHLPGQDAATALVSLLWGEESPSGRLPYTVAKKASDYGVLQGPCQASSSNDASDPQCTYSEGLNIDYRWFLNSSIAPRFEFGYGLTYTTFEYSNLTVSLHATSSNQTAQPVWANGTTDQNSKLDGMGQGGLTALFDSVGTVECTVANKGKVEAGEVSQLYLTMPGTDINGNARTKVLRGFSKNRIGPGDSANVEFNLRRKDVSVWDVVKQAWVVPAGKIVVEVGRSVLDLPLSGSHSA